VLNLFFLYGLATWWYCHATGRVWSFGVRYPAVEVLFAATLALSVFQMVIRAQCARRVYGWRFAMGVPVRTLLGNWLNCVATGRALRIYGLAKLRGESLVWVKTEHAYPNPAGLYTEKRLLGEILVGSQYSTQADVDEAMALKTGDERLGEYLVRTGKLSEEELYEALSLQQNLPLGKPQPSEVSELATHSVPAEVSRRWHVLPFRIAAGKLFVAGSELPSDEMTQELQRCSCLEVRFHLVTPTEFKELAAAYLS